MKTILALIALALPASSWGYCESEKVRLQTTQESLIKCERRYYDTSQMCAADRVEVENARTKSYLCEQVHAPKAPSPPDPCGEKAAIKSAAIKNIQPNFIYCRDNLKKTKGICVEFACNPYYEASGNYSKCLIANQIRQPNHKADLCARFRMNKEYSSWDTLGGR